MKSTVVCFPSKIEPMSFPKKGHLFNRSKRGRITPGLASLCLAFLKPRVISEWREMMQHLLEFIMSDQNFKSVIINYNSLDLIFPLHLTGAYTKFPFTREIDYLRSNMSPGFLCFC